MNNCVTITEGLFIIFHSMVTEWLVWPVCFNPVGLPNGIAFVLNSAFKYSTERNSPFPLLYIDTVNGVSVSRLVNK